MNQNYPNFNETVHTYAAVRPSLEYAHADQRGRDRADDTGYVSRLPKTGGLVTRRLLEREGFECKSLAGVCATFWDSWCFMDT